MSDTEQTVQAQTPEGQPGEDDRRPGHPGEGHQRPDRPGEEDRRPDRPGEEDRRPDQQRSEAEAERSAVDLDMEELVKAAAKRDEYLAIAQRTQADFENYRKRVARESAAAQQRGLAKLAKELLPALDSLDRAIAASGGGGGGEPATGARAGAGAGAGGGGGGEPATAAQGGDPPERAPAGEPAAGEDSLLHGVKLVRGELHAALARLGIESFSPEGERFDPAEHEAMAQRPVDGAQPGCVAEVYQAGWRMGSEVIRPARVLVAA